ncbi:Phosphatidylinositol glycan anchor biosynthesis class U protein OS=Homo sapiens GN=PIGU PE=1 SV=3 [Rhizoctonia solani AG-1 IB]|uniref:Phosphatidylinositol glycan anchor biosynthesis class U protein n=1 Tax=Thanatephorus cucumeris (strain AG1-IB / isolate 7/3/14) TaxID=1108050 RepID=A0A0B7FVC4_THACB|nr:Phosphatidylinositol glycan anchor biosynthesis class U protein OS=Homo sapiens GN=PIGU PE=1 SV=3 [Rhizoctonia solani AG-1 IB]
MKVVVVIFALVALRLALFTTPIPRLIQDDYQLASPVTSFSRLKEGIFLLEKGIDPYTGGVFLHSPLFLALFSTVFPLSNLGSAILWSALDGITAWCLVSLWRIRSSIRDDRKEVLISAIYLLNPYNILPTLARSTSTIDVALTVLTLLFACQKRTGPALVTLATLVHVSLPSVLIVVPAIMLLVDVRAPASMLANPTTGNKTEKDGADAISNRSSHWKAIFMAVEWAVYMAVLAFSGHLATGSWNWVWRSWGAVVTMSDATPNCGLWWYFFTEMFDHYRPFFLFAFSAHPLIYIAPICMKFRHDPFYAAYLLLGISATLKSYPTLADAGLFISLMSIFPETFSYLRHPLPTFLLHLHSALLMPLASHLWLSQGTGNANFLYAATLVFGLANLAMVVDAVWAGLRAAFVTAEGEEVVQL